MPKTIRNSVYSLATKDDSAELTLYGDIVETVPTDWWTGKPVEGEFITLDTFLQDLDTVKGKKSLAIRLNSYGGDAGVSNTIHNRLRELSKDGTALTCTVDGVAMSGGSLIMCACDTVRVNPSSLIMIHKCWSDLWGSYNADELRDMARTQDAWDNAQIEIYHRKTGIGKTQLSHMMSDTTYMTGREAVEKGFADELIEDEEPVAIAASANGRVLFAKGRAYHLPAGVFAPDSIPTVTPAAQAADEANTQTAEAVEGGKPMTLAEFLAQNPEAQAEINSSVAEAQKAERERVAAIDKIAHLFPAEMVQEAKYGTTACTAEDLAYRGAIEAANTGRSFLSNLAADHKESGVENVSATPAPQNESPEVDAAAAARAAMERFKAMKKEAR